MSKTTFTGYVPSLKAKHKATITNGKAIESKGGSIRYTIQGEYEGRKTFPKTVSKHDFENVYGFDAKAAEGELVGIIALTEDQKPYSKRKLKKAKVIHERSYIEGAGEVKKIIPLTTDEGYSLPAVEEALEWSDEEGWAVSKLKSMKYQEEMAQDPDYEHIGGGRWVKKQSDTVGSPSPASVEPPAPSEKPFPQEPTNADFSATTERVIITLGDDPEDDEDEEDEEIEEESDEDEEETEDEEEDEEESSSNENGEDDDSDEEKDEKVEDEDEEQEEEDSEDEDEDEEEFEAVSVEVEREKKEEEPEDEDEDGLLTPMNVALGLGAVALGVAVLGAEGEGVCGCGINCVCDCGCAESGVCNCGESCPCDCGCGVESFGTDSLVEEPDWIPDGDGRALGQQNLDINLSPLHAEQNEYHTSNIFYAEGEDLQKMTSSEFVPFDQITSEIQQEWDETTAPIAADYEPLNEPSNSNFSAEDTQLQCVFGLVDENGRHAHPKKVIRFEDSCPKCGAVEGDGCVQRIPAKSPHEQYLDSMTEAEKEANRKTMATFREELRMRRKASENFSADTERRMYYSWDDTKSDCMRCYRAIMAKHPTWEAKYDGMVADFVQGDFSPNFDEYCDEVMDELEERIENFSAEDECSCNLNRDSLVWVDYDQEGNTVSTPLSHLNECLMSYEQEGKLSPYYQIKHDGCEKHMDKGEIWNLPFMADTVGSPSPTFNEGITGQDGPSAEPTNSNFSAEGGLSKNAQYAIGLAALGVGIALWNGDWVSKMFDRFKR